MVSSTVRGRFIQRIQKAVIENEKGRFDDASLLIRELNWQIDKGINKLRRDIQDLENRPEYFTDGGLQYRTSWNNGLIDSLRQMSTDISNSVCNSSLKHFIDTFTKTYSSQTNACGLEGSFVLPDKRAIIEAINYPWSGQMWSNRVWNNTNRVTQNLQNEIIGALITGDSYVNVAKRIDRTLIQRGQNIKYVTERIVRTETARVRYIADTRFYKDSGVKKLKFCAIIDSKTSKVCRDNDKIIFDFGKEPPIPLHPHCRSTYLPEIEEKTVDEWIEKIKQAKENDKAMVSELKGEFDKPNKTVKKKTTVPKKKKFVEGVKFLEDEYGRPYTEVRNNINYYNVDKDLKYIQQYNKLKTYEDFEKWQKDMIPLIRNREVSSDFRVFLDDMETMLKAKKKLNVPDGFRYTLSKKEAIVQGEKYLNKSIYKKIKEEEKKAIRDYSGSAYQKINGYLRGYEKYVSDEIINETIPNLDKALRKGALNKDTVLFRGSDINMFSEEFVDRLMDNPENIIGETFSDKGFVSTSILGSSSFNMDIRLQILAPKGTQGLYIRDYSRYQDEMEFLLPSNTEFRIIKAEMRDNTDTYYNMVVEIVEK